MMRTRRISDRAKVWIARLLIGLVLFFNLQCAFLFLIFPETYMGSFELGGVIGESMVRALGLLFLMWNVPYVVAVSHPYKRIWSLYEAVLMQTIGFLGESLLVYYALPTGYNLLRLSVYRFMWFDGGGLLLLLVAVSIVRGVDRDASQGDVSKDKV